MALLIGGLSLLAAIITLLVFVTGKNLPDFFATPDAVDHSSAEMTTSLVLADGLRPAGDDNTFEVVGETGSLRVNYATLLKGIPARGTCTAVVTYQEDDEVVPQVARSNACSDTVPSPKSTGGAFFIVRGGTSAVIKIRLMYNGKQATKTILVRTVYANF